MSKKLDANLNAIELTQAELNSITGGNLSAQDSLPGANVSAQDSQRLQHHLKLTEALAKMLKSLGEATKGLV